MTPWKKNLRESIDIALHHSNDILEFVQILRDNFNIEAEFTDRSLVFRKDDENIVVRGYKLGGSYSRKGILKNIGKGVEC